MVAPNLRCLTLCQSSLHRSARRKPCASSALIVQTTSDLTRLTSRGAMKATFFSASSPPFASLSANAPGSPDEGGVAEGRASSLAPAVEGTRPLCSPAGGGRGRPTPAARRANVPPSADGDIVAVICFAISKGESFAPPLVLPTVSHPFAMPAMLVVSACKASGKK